MVTKWYKLFLECPSGFKNIANDLNGSQEFTELGEADITKCEAACNDRSGCTAFEFNHAGEENYKCGTYTGGVSDILTINTGGNSWSTEGYQKSTWTSCYKGISSTSSYYYHYYYYYYYFQRPVIKIIRLFFWFQIDSQGRKHLLMVLQTKLVPEDDSNSIIISCY